MVGWLHGLRSKVIVVEWWDGTGWVLSLRPIWKLERKVVLNVVLQMIKPSHSDTNFIFKRNGCIRNLSPLLRRWLRNSTTTSFLFSALTGSSAPFSSRSTASLPSLSIWSWSFFFYKECIWYLCHQLHHNQYHQYHHHHHHEQLAGFGFCGLSTRANF